MEDDQQRGGILELNNLSKTYSGVNEDLTVLSGVTFKIGSGEIVSIVGPSGSGKTTLLGLCAGLDKPTTGDVNLCGRQIGKLSEDERAEIRNKNVGFIFQNFQLIPTLTALENVMIPMELQGKSGAKSKSIDLLTRVGLGQRLDHYPSQLSGGEQQRVSIARAFCNNPQILFADEPTGNLDEDTGAGVEALLFDLNKENGTTLIIVTHDLELANKTDRIIRLKGGQIVEDSKSESLATI